MPTASSPQLDVGTKVSTLVYWWKTISYPGFQIPENSESGNCILLTLESIVERNSVSNLPRVTQAKCQNAGLIGRSFDVKSLLWFPVILEYSQDLITVRDDT